MGFHAYINEMHGSRSNPLLKNLIRQRCAEGFNSGVKDSLTDSSVSQALTSPLFVVGQYQSTLCLTADRWTVELVLCLLTSYTACSP
jgi:hypothetical protein